MELVNKLLITPAIETPVRSRVQFIDKEWLKIIATGLAGIALLVTMVRYNLDHVPSTEVSKIYRNAGSAVQQTFAKKRL